MLENHPWENLALKYEKETRITSVRDWLKPYAHSAKEQTDPFLPYIVTMQLLRKSIWIKTYNAYLIISLQTGVQYLSTNKNYWHEEPSKLEETIWVSSQSL